MFPATEMWSCGLPLFPLLLGIIDNRAMSAVHSDVNVAGSTVGASFSRSESRGMAHCPAEHPFACASGSKCSGEPLKPSSGGTGCDGGLTDLYSPCCPDGSLDCGGYGEVCKSHPTNGTFCPSTHPFPFDNGLKCCSDPYKPAIGSYSDCDGGLLAHGDKCCKPGKSVVCRTSGAFACRKNPAFGNLCPPTHRYPCASGTKCSKSPWKPTTGGGDCDGKRLTEGSVCCPATDVIDCNGDTRYKCLVNHPSKMLMHTGAWTDKQFHFIDVRRECISGRLHDYPADRNGPGIGNFKDRLILCGGSWLSDCHEYNPTEGWTGPIGNLHWGMFGLAAFTVDEGLPTERLYFAGGHNGGGYRNEVAFFDGTSFNEDTNGMQPMPTSGWQLNFVVLDSDRILRTGGRNHGVPMHKAFIYSRSANNWTEVASTESLCGAAIHQYGIALHGNKAYVSCDVSATLGVMDTDTFVITPLTTPFTYSYTFPLVVGDDIYYIHRLYVSAVNKKYVLQTETGLWREITSFESFDPQWPVQAVIPDDWFTC